MHQISLLAGLITFISLLSGRMDALAQQYPLQHYSVKHGLAHANVFRIYQDSKGFVWLSTAYGLSRFDGNTFQNYTVHDGLSPQAVMSFNERTNEEAWVCTYGNGIRIMKNNRLAAASFNDKMPAMTLHASFEDSIAWVIGVDGRHSLYRIDKGQVSPVILKDEKGGIVQFYEMMNAGHSTYFAGSNGIYCHKREKGLTKVLADIVKERVYDFRIDSAGTFWIGMENKVVHATDRDIIKTYPTTSGSGTSDLLIDRNRNVWVAVPEQGIVVIKDGNAINITQELNIGNVMINDLFEDTEGNIWIGTHGKGFYIVSSLGEVNYPVSEHLINTYAQAITVAQNGKLFIGSIGTVSMLSGDRLQAFPVKQLKANEYIYCMSSYKNNLLIGTPYGMISKSLTYPYKETRISLPAVSCIVDHKRDLVWIGSYRRIFRLRNNRIVGEDSVNIKRCNSIMITRAGRVYVGTDSGYNCFDENTFTHVNFSGNWYVQRGSGWPGSFF